MRLASKREKESFHWRGKISNASGYFLSFLCIYRMVISIVNYFLQREFSKDPISAALEMLLLFFHLNIDTTYWSRQCSFFFILYLVGTSLKGFLSTLNSMSKETFSSLSSRTMMLTLLYILGLYFVSSIVLIRMSLPPLYREGLNRLLGDISITLYSSTFDSLSLLSSLLTLVFLAIDYKYKTNILQESIHGGDEQV